MALLHGVTGSGKTELYIELAKKTLAEGKGVILLVPEIALTPQLHRRFEESLGTSVGLWHSAVADGVRRDMAAALQNPTIKSHRRGAFSGFRLRPGSGTASWSMRNMIPTYKQEDRFRYNARDLAIVRGKITGAFVLWAPPRRAWRLVSESKKGAMRSHGWISGLPLEGSLRSKSSI